MFRKGPAGERVEEDRGWDHRARTNADTWPDSRYVGSPKIKAMLIFQHIYYKFKQGSKQAHSYVHLMHMKIFQVRNRHARVSLS